MYLLINPLYFKNRNCMTSYIQWLYYEFFIHKKYVVQYFQNSREEEKENDNSALFGKFISYMVFILCGFTPHKKFNSNPKEVVEVDFLHHFVRGEGKCDMILFKLFFFCDCKFRNYNKIWNFTCLKILLNRYFKNILSLHP